MAGRTLRQMAPIYTLYSGDTLQLEGQGLLGQLEARVTIHQGTAPHRTAGVTLDVRGLQELEEQARELRRWIEARRG